MQISANLYGTLGTTSTAALGLSPIVTTVAPASNNVMGPNGTFQIGQVWINSTANLSYQLTSFSTSNGVMSANWTVLGTNAGTLDTLTGDSGGVITPTAANINVLGTANQITTAGASPTLTLSLPSAIIAPGSLTTTTNLAVGTSATVATTLGVTGLSTLGAVTAVGTASINGSGAAVTTIGTGGTGATNIGNATGNTAVTGSLTASTSLTATAGAITATNGNLVLGTSGNKILSTSVGTTTAAGANSFGTVTLVGGTATVATTSITTSSIVFLTRQTIGATGAAALGMLSRGTIINGTSFVINALATADATALAATDVSSVGWFIVN